MPYDVRMPDGTVIRNVPDGTKRADLEHRWKTTKLRQQTAQHPVIGKVLSGLAGLSDQLTFGIDDEVGATVDTLLPGRGPDMWDSSFGKAWGQNQRSRQARKDQLASENPGSSLAGSVAGGVLPVILSGGAGAARSAPGLVRSTVTATGQGGLYGFNSGKGGVRERLKRVPEGVAWGAGGNLAGRALGKLAGKVVGGTADKNVRILHEAGVTMTPGQRAGKRSLRNLVEDKVLGSIPLLSDIPEAARQRGANDLRVAVANRVLDPIGESIPAGTAIGNEAIGNIQGRVYGALDNAAGNLSLTADNQLAQDFAQVAQNAPRLVGTDGAQQVTANIDHLNDRMSFGTLTGDSLRETLGELRSLASTSPGQMGQQFWALHDNIVDAMGRQNAPEALEAFTKAREATTLLKRMEAAASGAGVVNGEFGPTQLLQAAKKRGFGTSTSNVASGEARLMDLANAAADVMRNTTANSGTVPRALAGGAGLGGLSAATGMVSPAAGAALGASMLGYVPGIDKVLQKLALSRPAALRAVGDAIDRNNPVIGGLGVGGALGLFGQTP